MQMFKRRENATRSPGAGFTLIETLIAGLVLTVGLVGAMGLIAIAMANDNRNRIDSSSTILSQMTMEIIASAPANSGSSLTAADCNPIGSSSSHIINTAGSASGAGSPLRSDGSIDFTQTAVSGYSMPYYSCQASTGDRQEIYDVRWNIKTLSSNTNLIAVAAQKSGHIAGGNFFAVPVTLKMIVGL